MLLFYIFIVVIILMYYLASRKFQSLKKAFYSYTTGLYILGGDKLTDIQSTHTHNENFVKNHPMMSILSSIKFVVSVKNMLHYLDHYAKILSWSAAILEFRFTQNKIQQLKNHPRKIPVTLLSRVQWFQISIIFKYRVLHKICHAVAVILDFGLTIKNEHFVRVHLMIIRVQFGLIQVSSL